jgi:cell division protein FtsB
MLGRSAPRIILLVVAVVVGYLLYTTVNATLNSYRIAGDEQGVRQEIAGLESDQAKLVALRDYLSSDEYIESVARRMLGLVKPGEKLVRVSSSEGEAEKPEDGARGQSTGRDWWESLFGP